MSSGAHNSLGRFSNRVDDYVRYRPTLSGGPDSLSGRKGGVGGGRAVADVGSGTGIFTRLLLETGAKVFAVEPNAKMRSAAEAESGQHPGFTGVTGTADVAVTGLARPFPSRSVTCAQAFHQFEPAGTRREFIRNPESGWLVCRDLEHPDSGGLGFRPGLRENQE